MNDGVTVRIVTKYYPGMKSVTHQGIIYFVKAKEKTADSKYEDMQTLEFNIELSTNQYINWNRFEYIFVFLSKIKKKYEANDIDANIKTVNTCFAHWVKEKDIKSYGDDLEVAPSTLVDIYQYFDAVIKRTHSLQ